MVMVYNATFNNISATNVHCGSQFYWWRKPEYPENTIDNTLPHVQNTIDNTLPHVQNTIDNTLPYVQNTIYNTLPHVQNTSCSRTTFLEDQVLCFIGTMREM
jgi:hypothetical protein